MAKIILLVLFAFCSNGCTLIGFYSGMQIDKSNHYSIENPTYDSLNIKIGTPITLHLKSDKTINGRFSKILYLNDSLSQDTLLSKNNFGDSLVCINENDMTSNWIIALNTYEKYVEIPNTEIEKIDVKPYTRTILITTGAGLALDILAIILLQKVEIN